MLNFSIKWLAKRYHSLFPFLGLEKLPVANRLHKSPKNIHQSTKRLIGIRKASIYKGFSDWPLQLRATNNKSESFPFNCCRIDTLLLQEAYIPPGPKARQIL